MKHSISSPKLRKNYYICGIMLTRVLLSFFVLLSLQFLGQTRTSLECVDREFNVVVHIVKDTARIPILSPSIVPPIITRINTEWSPICMKFNLCETRLIDNFNFLQWHQDTMELEFNAIHYEPRVINIYVVEKLIKPSGFSGYATLGGISKRGVPYIIVEANAGSITWIHELGHYFGLEHTFEPPLGLVNNSNWATTGDKIEDTPADPNGMYDNLTCLYLGGSVDANGQYYNPLLENFMSYYGSCRKSFTHNQYEKMIATYKLDPQAHF